MPDERLDFGVVESISAQALGQAGRRTFCITLSSFYGKAMVWVEKEQLLEFAIAIKQLISTTTPPNLPKSYKSDDIESISKKSPEFKASEIRLGYDQDTALFMIEAAGIELMSNSDPEESRTVLIFGISRQLADELSDQSLQVVAAGRAKCPLCHEPIDPDGHICPKSNGHHKGNLEFA